MTDQAQEPIQLTDAQIKQHFQMFAQHYNFLIGILHNLKFPADFYRRIADHFDDAYVWSEKAFGILSVQAIEREKVKLAESPNDAQEPLDAA